MRTVFYFAVVCILSLSIYAQSPSPTPTLYSKATLSDLAKLRDAALSSDYAYLRTEYLTNNIGPRLSGSRQAQRAVEYVADEMRKAGLEVRLQELKVPHWERGKEAAEVIEWQGMASGTTHPLNIVALGGSVSTGENGMIAEIVVVGSFEELAALGKEKVAGKIVVFNNKFDRDLASAGFGLAAYGQAVQYRFGGAMAAARLGAVAVLVRSAGASENRLVHTGTMGYADDAPKIPAGSISAQDADLLASLAADGPTKVKVTLTPRTLPDAVSHNVIGELRGIEKPDEIVVVGGHLDSWDLGTGALDDACGVAVSMQAAYLIKKLGLKPKRTIRVVAFMNEENGGVGGREYFVANKDTISRHFAAIESDLGASHVIGFNFAGRPEALPFFAPLTSILRVQGATQIQIQAGVGADIDPLTKAGVPSFAPWFDQRTYFNYHHTAADTFVKIDPKDLKKLGSLMGVLTYGLANLEQPLPR